MSDLLKTIAVAIGLFVVAGAVLFSALWWVGLIFGGFAVLLTVAAVMAIFGGAF